MFYISRKSGMSFSGVICREHINVIPLGCCIFLKNLQPLLPMKWIVVIIPRTVLLLSLLFDLYILMGILSFASKFLHLVLMIVILFFHFQKWKHLLSIILVLHLLLVLYLPNVLWMFCLRILQQTSTN